MKVTKLTIKNVGLIADTSIDLNKPLICFYGEIRQGKSTILNAVRWVCGGEFPADIIRHGEKEASVELAFDGGCISRSWYVSKEGETKARSVVFVRSGKPVPSPVAEIKRFLNPFLLNQDHLADMGETERRAYFIDLFGVDTSKLDGQAFDCSREAQNLRAKIKGYGEIDLTPVEEVDASALKAELEKVRRDHAQKVEAVDSFNAAARDENGRVDKALAQLENIRASISELETKLGELKKREAEGVKWLEGHSKRAEGARPAAPDTSALEAKIQDAGVQNVKARLFKKNAARAKEREADEAKVSELEAKQRKIKADKTALLKGITDSCKIKELAFDESGNFTYQGTQAGMLSTSQIMRLSSELSALYPEGFGLDLIDRAESLGKSIFGFVDRAKAENKTILATIVGERPAKVPENVGVFVVENGKVMA